MRHIKTTLMFVVGFASHSFAQPLYSTRNDFVFYLGGNQFGVQEVTLNGNFDSTTVVLGEHYLSLPVPIIAIVGIVVLTVLVAIGVANWCYSRSRTDAK